MPLKLGIGKLGAMANVWMAQHEGVFARHGLDVELVEMHTGDTLAAVQVRAVQITLQIPGTAMVAKEQGFDIVLVGQNETAGTTPPVSNAVMVAARSSANSIKDLAGLKIAT